MSFILDALRKSESERQRDASPSLSRIPDAVPRRRLPLWAAGTMGGLAAAVLGLAAALWLAARGPAPGATPTAAATPTAGATPAARATPPAKATPAPLAAGPLARSEARDASPGPQAARPSARGSAGLYEDAVAESRPADGRAASRQPGEAVSLDARDVSDAGGASDAKEARDDAGEASFADAGGADDGAAGIEGAPSATAASASPALGAAPALLPSYETAAGNDSSLPALTLEFHAFADDPARRFVYINGEKYVEGATLKEGPKVVRITADGVVLDVSGRQFLLGRK